MTNRDPAVANVISTVKNVGLITGRLTALELPELISVTSSSYIPTASDVGKTVVINTSSGAVQITINQNLLINEGSRINFVWYGAAISVTFSVSGSPLPTIGATPGNKLRARYSAATLLCLGERSFVLIGDLSA
jgi:hypothetical protein